MLQSIAIAGTLLALVCAIGLFFFAESVPASRLGLLAVTGCVVALPLLATTGSAAYSVKASSETEFCLRCHEMTDYGKTLFVDDPSVLPAVHYQNRLVDRDHACYVCHKDYAMFGNVTTKLNGLHHLRIHYLGTVPAPGEFELYAPYPNSNCLHCHEDSRRFIEAAPHQEPLESLIANETSCLSCHSQGHGHDRVERGELWLSQ